MMRLATLLLVVVATALAQKSAQAADFGAYKVEGLSVQKAVISPNSFVRFVVANFEEVDSDGTVVRYSKNIGAFTKWTTSASSQPGLKIFASTASLGLHPEGNATVVIQALYSKLGTTWNDIVVPPNSVKTTYELYWPVPLDPTNILRLNANVTWTLVGVDAARLVNGYEGGIIHEADEPVGFQVTSPFQTRVYFPKKVILDGTEHVSLKFEGKLKPNGVTIQVSVPRAAQHVLVDPLITIDGDDEAASSSVVTASFILALLSLLTLFL